jgi:hypothetical protein
MRATDQASGGWRRAFDGQLFQRHLNEGAHCLATCVEGVALVADAEDAAEDFSPLLVAPMAVSRCRKFVR